MANHQSVKVLSLRQLLALGGCLVVAGCGGEEIDFSKPTTGSGGASTFSYPPADASEPGEVATEVPAGSAAEIPAQSDETTPVKKETKAESGIVRIGKAGDSDDETDYDEEDDDNPSAHWRKRTFKLNARQRAALAASRRVAFSNNGRLVAGIDESGEVIVFGTRSGDVQSVYELTDVEPVAVAVSDTANLMLIGTANGALRLFEIKDLSRFDQYAREAFKRTQLARLPVRMAESPLTVLQFVSRGSELITADETGQVQLWSAEQRPTADKDWEPHATIQAHEAPVTAVAVSAEREFLATAAEDGSVKIWSINSTELILELEPATVPALTLCATSSGFAIGRANGVIEILSDFTSETPRLEEVLSRNPIGITSLLVEPKHGRLVTGLESGAAALLDMKTGKTLSSRKAHRNAVLTLASAPGHSRILTTAIDGYFGSWSPPELRQRTRGVEVDDADAISKPILRFRVCQLSDQDDDEDGAGYTRDQMATLASFRSEPSSQTEFSAETVGTLNLLRAKPEAERGTIRSTVPADDAGARPVSERSPALVRNITTRFEVASVENVRVALSSTGETLVLAVSPPKGRRDGSVVAWDVPTGVPLRRWTSDRVYRQIELLGNGRWMVPFLKPIPRREEAAIGLFDLVKGDIRAAPAETRVVAHRDRLIATGATGSYGATAEVLQLRDPSTLNVTASFSAFEASVPAVAVLPGREVLVSLRDRLSMRLLLLSESLEEKQVVFEEKTAVPWIDQRGKQTDIMGITDLATSTDGGTLVTHGRFDSRDFRFTIWKRKGGRFDQKDARGVKKTVSFLLQGSVIGPRMLFVHGNQNELALLSPTGLVIVNTETGQASTSVQLPSGLSAFEPNGRYVAAHDGSGSVELRDLTNVRRAPRSFRAHDAPLMALAFSQSGQLLATVGEDNRLKVWRLGDWAEGVSAKKN